MPDPSKWSTVIWAPHISPRGEDYILQLTLTKCNLFEEQGSASASHLVEWFTCNSYSDTEANLTIVYPDVIDWAELPEIDCDSPLLGMHDGTKGFSICVILAQVK